MKDFFVCPELSVNTTERESHTILNIYIKGLQSPKCSLFWCFKIFLKMILTKRAIKNKAKEAHSIVRKGHKIQPK